VLNLAADPLFGQRISIQRPPNPWRAVKVERRLVAVVARVGRHAAYARTSSSLGDTSSAPVVKCRLKCSSSHAVANRPITRTCRSGPTALLAKCATTRALCSAAIVPARGSAYIINTTDASMR
jgi:hypothetical protein